MAYDSATALRLLREGNERFVEGTSINRFTPENRASSLEGQKPYAVVVGCSDSRVPVEIVFDVGIGELFVVRAAGHVMSHSGLASIRFAVQTLGTRTVVVLGHEDCGAVSAALTGYAPDWLMPVVENIDVSGIDPAHAPADADDLLLAAAVDQHVRATVDDLRDWFDRLELADGSPVVVGAAYKLASGEVHWLD